MEMKRVFFKLFLGAFSTVLVQLSMLASVESPRLSIVFEGEVSADGEFRHVLGQRFLFLLQPIEYGWVIVVTDEITGRDLSRLTPPLHFVPNPRYIEGWHFRNVDNTGPNGPGAKNVNAPQEIREFIFSPKVGISIGGPQQDRALSYEDIETIRNFGSGTFEILDYKLVNLIPNTKANFGWLKFRVRASWAKSEEI